MSATDVHTPAASTPLPRVWPALLFAGAFWTFKLVAPSLGLPIFVGFFSLLIACASFTLLFMIWWFTNGRVPGRERLLLFGLLVLVAFAAKQLSDPSIGLFCVLVYGLPVVFTAWALWFVVARRRSIAVQRWGTLAIFCLVLGYLTLVRMDGVDGSQNAAIHWRWSPVAEDLFLAERAKARSSSSAPVAREALARTLAIQPGDWPAFRGSNRDGALHGVKIATDWNSAPPKQLWRKRVGPAWSSVAIVDGRLFTQEQRGEAEAVISLDAVTGEEIWAHEDKSRFWEAVAGAGPRATPTFVDGRLYTLGGKRMLDCLDAGSGRLLWSCDIVKDSGALVPMWGFSSSPLVVAGMVVVYAGGEPDKGLLAYHADSGKPAWTAATGPISYSSPQLATIGDKEQILFLSDQGVMSVDPASGKLLWEHAAAAPKIWRAVQPRALGNSQVLIGSEDLGSMLIDVKHEKDVWTATENWASRAMRPAFNDSVLYDGSLYGFDGSILCCLDVQTGKRRWKQGRYGHGQVLLLADQGILLVLSEAGEAVLVAANPKQHEELGRFQAIEGKTWNHPVIAHGRLYVRNDEELACYELKLAEAR
jgi:outer membrane protein assembly factor BamB